VHLDFPRNDAAVAVDVFDAGGCLAVVLQMSGSDALFSEVGRERKLSVCPRWGPLEKGADKKTDKHQKRELKHSLFLMPLSAILKR
jgi:hypothetical protein